MLLPRAALLPIKPIHAGVKPIARHKDHTLGNVLCHDIQLFIAWTHLQRRLLIALRHYRREDKLIAFHLERLRPSEGQVAVDRVRRTWTEVALVGLQLWITPLVARPVRMARVTAHPCASMICDLLHLFVPFVHIKFSTATLALEALSIAVVVALVTSGGPRHIHQIEIQIAAASRTIRLEIEVHGESLPHPVGLEEILRFAVIRGRLLHQVKPVRRFILDSCSVIDDRRAWKVVLVLHAVFINDQGGVRGRRACRRKVWLTLNRYVLAGRLHGNTSILRTKFSKLEHRGGIRLGLLTLGRSRSLPHAKT